MRVGINISLYWFLNIILRVAGGEDDYDDDVGQVECINENTARYNTLVNALPSYKISNNDGLKINSRVY